MKTNDYMNYLKIRIMIRVFTVAPHTVNVD